MFKYVITEELDLRLLEPRHAEALFQLTDQSRDYLREWLPWVDFTKSINDSNNFIDSTLKQFSQNNGFQAGIWYKGHLAGVIGLHSINWSNHSTSIGYWLGEGDQGKGIMTQACAEVVDYCFEELNLQRVEIRAATENLKSAKIPEKLNFPREGCLKQSEKLYDKYVDHYVYGLTKEDYKSEDRRY
ncbi:MULTISPECIES: GNAT family N-acetyltransferase [Bacillaceae]|uniref:GNAT family N-acetyltransferase n=1 Tax=Evansella alkalicola TaxID=745819 RepID=A0ABS6JP89_9BACI|nr:MULTISPECIES: GNAT family protein [Bacillaceae]MBU9720377.1 GNAT family N-acetyltransferase [Bacillus alkalicola]